MKRFQGISGISLTPFILALLISGTIPCSAAPPDQQAVAKAVNAFAGDLYGQLRKQKGNLFFSPYSISMCLAMVYNGARGTTESQMAKTLHLGLDRHNIDEAFRDVNAKILAAGQEKAVEINIANALWAEKTYVFKKEYLEALRVSYQGGLRQVDFRNSAQAARKTINSWVEKRTKDKIKDLLAPGTTSPDTRLILTNAIYFKCKWGSQFDKNRTKEEPFYLLDGKEVKAPMMSQTERFGYAKVEGMQMLGMSYKGGELAMVVLLPSKQQRLEDFEQSITGDRLGRWIESLVKQKLETHLPRFKITREFQLNATLTGLGMPDAFSKENADFSGMTGKRDLFIGDAVHKAFVDVNEEGTEAAAATGIRMMGTGKPKPPPVFRADHPFVFLIRHIPSGCILFMGRVTRP